MKSATQSILMIIITLVSMLYGYSLNQNEFTRDQLIQAVAEEGYAISGKMNADLYNAGFRAGSIEELSIAVECYGYGGEIVNRYNSQTEYMESLGELENTSIYCGE